MTTLCTPKDDTGALNHTFCFPVRISQWDMPSIQEQWQKGGESWRILLVQSGKGEIELAGQTYEAANGFALLSGPGRGLQPARGSKGSLRGQLIEYRCVLGNGEAGNGLAHETPIAGCSPLIQRLAGELAALWKQPELGGRFRVQEQFAALLTELERECAAEERPVCDWLEQALKVMEEQYREDLTREQLAAEAGVTPEHFSRTFRKATGRSFNEHLTLLRIRQAQLGLLEAPTNLNALAQKVGYKEGAYLSRRFKEAVGISPTAYIKRNKRIAALNPNHTASLVALGIRPELGVYTPWLEKVQAGQNIGLGTTYSFYGQSATSCYDALAKVNPDLIVHYSAAQENKGLLELAPVLELPFRTMNWREQFRLIADTVGRGAQAESWLERFDERVYRMNARLDMELGDRGTAIVWELCRDRAYGISASYGRGSQLLYHDIGFRPPDRMVEEGIDAKGYIETSVNGLADYPADHIFIVGLPEGMEGRLRIERLYHSEGWMSLEAVKRGRVYVLNHPDLFYGYDPLSSQAQLTKLSQALSGSHHKNA